MFDPMQLHDHHVLLEHLRDEWGTAGLIGEALRPVPADQVDDVLRIARRSDGLATGGVVRREHYVRLEPDEEFTTLDPAHRERSLALMREAAERLGQDGSRLWLPGDPAPLPLVYADEPHRPELTSARIDWVPQDAGIRKSMYVGLGTLIVIVLLVLLLT